MHCTDLMCKHQRDCDGQVENHCSRGFGGEFVCFRRMFLNSHFQYLISAAALCFLENGSLYYVLPFSSYLLGLSLKNLSCLYFILTFCLFVFPSHAALRTMVTVLDTFSQFFFVYKVVYYFISDFSWLLQASFSESYIFNHFLHFLRFTVKWWLPFSPDFVGLFFTTDRFF